ncbi:RDD family protein [Ekhidna sp.]
MEETKYSYATFWQRLLAHNIDLLPILGIYYLISIIISYAGFDIIIMGSVYILYHALFEVSKWQATPGKKWARLKVSDENQNHIILFKSVIRNLTKILSLILFFGGFIMILFNKRRKGLHDYIGGTLVLFKED